jgi:hypothetical protein
MTPFNIDEEMEEGHYDQTGCFQLKTKDVCRNLYLITSEINHGSSILCSDNFPNTDGKKTVLTCLT